MRHKIDHRKLNRTTEHRIAMLNNQAVSLIMHDRIKTTLPKAKELRRFVERLVTLAKKDTLHSRRLAARHVKDPEVLRKLFSELGPMYASRPGGYTRIMKLGFRRGDGAQEAIIEMVDRGPTFEEQHPEKGKKKKAAKKEETAIEEKAPAKKTSGKKKASPAKKQEKAEEEKVEEAEVEQKETASEEETAPQEEAVETEEVKADTAETPDEKANEEASDKKETAKAEEGDADSEDKPSGDE